MQKTKIKPENAKILKSGEKYLFEKFKFQKNEDNKMVAVSDKFVSGTLVDACTVWRQYKKKDCSSGLEILEKALVWNIVRFIPDENKLQWSSKETLTVHQTVITTGFFQIWKEVNQ